RTASSRSPAASIFSSMDNSSGYSGRASSVRYDTGSPSGAVDQLLLPEAAPPQERAREDQTDAHNLHQRHLAVEHRCPARIAAEEFNRAALDPIEDKIRADHLPRKALTRTEPGHKE